MKTNWMMMGMLAALVLGAAAFAQAPNTTAAPARPAFTDADGDGVCDNAPANCPRGQGQGRGVCPNFADADQDGKCDNFVDADGDGVCDSAPANRPQGRGVRRVSAGGSSRIRWSTGDTGIDRGARRGRAR